MMLIKRGGIKQNCLSRLFVLGCLATMLSGCGFTLEGAGSLPSAMNRTFLDSPDRNSPFISSLREALRLRGSEVVDSPSQADAVLTISSDDTGQRVLSVTARNIPREYEIYYAVTVSLRSGSTSLMAPRQSSSRAPTSMTKRWYSARAPKRSCCAKRSLQIWRDRYCAASKPPPPALPFRLADEARVARVRDVTWDAISELTRRYGVRVQRCAPDADLQHSYWGAPEAGISSAGITLRDDTPVHSLLHELCHIICMGPQRRAQFTRDAGGSDAEESAVCYLQVLLADQLTGFSAARCLADMDAWGYSFREGNAGAWFAGDGQDARDWLFAHHLIDAADRPTFWLRD